MISLSALKSGLNACNALIIAAFTYCIACYSCADSRYPSASEIEQYTSFSKRYQNMRITPTRLMDDETLFRSAEERRRSEMSIEHKLINNRWLVQSDSNTFSGPAAIGKLVRATLVTYWHNERAKKKQLHVASNAAEVKTEEKTAFENIENYQIRLSNSEVSLRFRYKF